jgi:type I restriction enzyme M protein
MHWVAPSEKNDSNGTLEKRLWESADQFRANSGLKSQEYSAPVLGLIFLRFAEVRFVANTPPINHTSPHFENLFCPNPLFSTGC